MTRGAALLSMFSIAIAACGDNQRPPSSAPPPGDAPTAADAPSADAPEVHGPFLAYRDPVAGALRLIRNAASTPTTIVLDLVVGDTALTGYSTGFDLPLAPDKVTLADFAPGAALSAGTEPVAAKALIRANDRPGRDLLVAGQSQKASGLGAVTTDTLLPPTTVLYTIRLTVRDPFVPGVVFDGTAADFVLPSGGLRNKLGQTIVEPGGVGIGKLEAQAR